MYIAGASQDAVLLMKAKMNFLATPLKPDQFIVNFEGAVPPPTGPMILLENGEIPVPANKLPVLLPELTSRPFSV